MPNRCRTIAGILLALVGMPSAAMAQQAVELPARDRLLGDTPILVYTVGLVDGPDPEVFGRIAAVAFDARDRLYVLDSQARRISVFDERGRFVRTIGRPGEGPGAYAAAGR
jgi:hypothetical protein